MNPGFHHDPVTGEYLYAGQWYETYTDALDAWQADAEARGLHGEALFDAAQDERGE